MEIVAKITKGQVTILREIRVALGVGAGDKVSFQQRGNVICILPKRASGRFEKYRGMGNPGIPKEIDSIEGIVRYLRELRGHLPEDDFDEAEFAAKQSLPQRSKRE